MTVGSVQTITYAQPIPGRFSVLLPVKGDGPRSYVLDVAPFLATAATGVALSSASATSTDASLTVSNVSNMDTAVLFTANAGAPGTLALISVTLVTTAGDIETFSVGQPIAGRPATAAKTEPPMINGAFFNGDGHLMFIRSDGGVLDAGPYPLTGVADLIAQIAAQSAQIADLSARAATLEIGGGAPLPGLNYYSDSSGNRYVNAGGNTYLAS